MGPCWAGNAAPSRKGALWLWQPAQLESSLHCSLWVAAGDMVERSEGTALQGQIQHLLGQGSHPAPAEQVLLSSVVHLGHTVDEGLR